MIVPCIVNSWLYSSLSTICRPGSASSERMSIAITPPSRNQANEVIEVEVADHLVVGGGEPADGAVSRQRRGRVGAGSACAGWTTSPLVAVITNPHQVPKGVVQPATFRNTDVRLW